jgi:hypothetical protein
MENHDATPFRVAFSVVRFSQGSPALLVNGANLLLEDKRRRVIIREVNKGGATTGLSDLFPSGNAGLGPSPQGHWAGMPGPLEVGLLRELAGHRRSQLRSFSHAPSRSQAGILVEWVDEESRMQRLSMN